MSRTISHQEWRWRKRRQTSNRPFPGSGLFPVSLAPIRVSPQVPPGLRSAAQTPPPLSPPAQPSALASPLRTCQGPTSPGLPKRRGLPGNPEGTSPSKSPQLSLLPSGCSRRHLRQHFPAQPLALRPQPLWEDVPAAKAPRHGPPPSARAEPRWRRKSPSKTTLVIKCGLSM